MRSSVLSKLWSFSIINQLTLFWFQLMYYWKWPQFWKKWGSHNCDLKTKGLYLTPLDNGQNDFFKRQFLALGVHSQSWILDNLSKKNSCQIDWCYKLLATIWQKIFLLSNVNCKVSNLKNKIADKQGQLALISKCQFDPGNII